MKIKTNYLHEVGKSRTVPGGTVEFDKDGFAEVSQETGEILLKLDPGISEVKDGRVIEKAPTELPIMKFAADKMRTLELAQIQSLLNNAQVPVMLWASCTTVEELIEVARKELGGNSGFWEKFLAMQPNELSQWLSEGENKPAA